MVKLMALRNYKQLQQKDMRKQDSYEAQEQLLKLSCNEILPF